jgi:hypothetical protein
MSEYILKENTLYKIATLCKIYIFSSHTYIDINLHEGQYADTTKYLNEIFLVLEHKTQFLNTMGIHVKFHTYKILLNGELKTLCGELSRDFCYYPEFNNTFKEVKV